MKLQKYKEYAPAIARYGVGIVFFIFGISQIINPENWVAWLPSFSFNLGITGESLIYINGAFDFIVGALLLIGIWIRPVALVGAVHIAGIIVSLGYNDIAIRDFGLLLVLISVFLNGSDKLCIIHNPLARVSIFRGYVDRDFQNIAIKRNLYKKN